MPIAVNDRETGWSFQVEATGGNAPPGGLVLKDVRHLHHNFARDVRVVGVWLEMELQDASGRATGTDTRFFPLQAPHFKSGPVQVLAPAPVTLPIPLPFGQQATFRWLRETDESLYFGGYFRNGMNHAALAVRVDHASEPALLAPWTNCDISAFNLSQVFLFSRYASSPAHEPGGVLTAARFHPVVKYEWTPNPALDHKLPRQRLKSFRVDYRLHLYLDGHLQNISGTQPQTANQAGLFADEDSLSMVYAPLALASAGAMSKAAFLAVEKPLVLEVVAPGLVEGSSIVNPGENYYRCWDNVHWWGSRAGGVLVSTPGAFHAAHVHWRWGAAVQHASHGGQQVFRPGLLPPPHKGLPISRQPGLAHYTALVDRDAWIQTLRLAVVRNESSLDPNRGGVQLSALSTWDFGQLFRRLRPSPGEIMPGGDLVLWFGVQVHSRTTKLVVLELERGGAHTMPRLQQMPVTFFTKPVGRLFIHGIFFAHEPETTGFGIGSTGPLHWPNDENAIRQAAQWERTP